MTRAVDETAAAFGRLDILVNNAGIGDGGAFAEVTPAAAMTGCSPSTAAPRSLRRRRRCGTCRRAGGSSRSVPTCRARRVVAPGLSALCGEQVGTVGDDAGARRGSSGRWDHGQHRRSGLDRYRHEPGRMGRMRRGNSPITRWGGSARRRRYRGGGGASRRGWRAEHHGHVDFGR